MKQQSCRHRRLQHTEDGHPTMRILDSLSASVQPVSMRRKCSKMTQVLVLWCCCCLLHSAAAMTLATSLVNDLIVNIGDNVLLDCEPLSSASMSLAGNRTHLFDGSHLHHHYRHQAHRPVSYVWCRHEMNNELDGVENKTCFVGDAYFIACENNVSTVTYRCYASERKPIVLKPLTIEGARLVKSFRLYVDRFSSVHRKREAIVQQRDYGLKSLSTRIRGCRPPRCKPYATVLTAQCSTIELSIRYPSNQYGYNASSDHWGTVLCNDHVGGYQIWLLGYGTQKKFLPGERIILDNLIPGKRYCFNGWAYNSCGRGPIFTLEGVCPKNDDGCFGGSDEHCELDVDYSY